MSSVAFDKVVPFWQYFVLDDMLVILAFKKWVSFFLCLICSSVDRRKYSEACFCSRSRCHLPGLFDGVEHRSAPHSGNLREEPMFNWIPFGAVWWIVCDSDIDSQSLCGLNEIPFELPAPGGIRPSSVAKDEDVFCVWVYVPEVLLPLLGEAVAGELRGVVAQPEGHVSCVFPDVVDAVWNHLAVGEGGVVVVGDFHSLRGVGTAVVSPEVAEEFLFLRVDAQHGNALLVALLPQPLDVPELFVAQLTVRHGQGLYRLAAGVSLRLDDLPDGVEAHLYMIIIRENGLELRRGKAEPFRVGILRKPGNVELHDIPEHVDILGVDGERALPSTTLLTHLAFIEVLFGLEFMATPVDGVAGDAEGVADNGHPVSAYPFGNNGGELPLLSLVSVFVVLHLLLCYNICWIILDTHNCSENSCNVNQFPADLRIYYVNNQ